MPTLLDTAEFALAKATLDETLQRIERARQDRLESLRRDRAINQASLESAKRGVRELPIDIARQDAEIAKLEATTGADILREAMDAPEVVLHAQPPGEVVEVQSQKPHACPRCDEGMREVEITHRLTWPFRDTIEAGTRLRAVKVESTGYIEVDSKEHCTRMYRFVRPDLPPQSEWCDGSGKGGAE